MNKSMTRPTLLVAEPEASQALSSRKLVLETGKFNVITAHSGREFMDLVRRFPKVDCAIVHGLMNDVSCEEMLAEAKQCSSAVKTIFLGARVGASCKNADHVISSHDPQALLDLVRKLFGDPRDS